MELTIWFISKYASPPKYGVGARLLYLAREFKRCGHNPIVITSDANHLAKFPSSKSRYNKEIIDNVELWWVRTLKYLKTASITRVLSWFDFEIKLFLMPRKKLPDPEVIIISSLSLLSIVYGYFLKKKYKARLVFEIRDIWPLTMVEEGAFSKWHPLSLFLGWVEKFGYKRADLIVGTMPNLKLHVYETLGYERPFYCSPLGYAPDWSEHFEPLPQGFIDEYLPANKFIVGYAGSIGTTSALDTLIECVELLRNREDIYFVFVGDGDLKQEYVRKTNHYQNISFAPKINKNQVSDFLDKCDILYLSMYDSPVWRFGQSLNKMIDYMMAGKPIIASYSGYQSMLNEADCGEFIPANDTNALYDVIERFVTMSADEREAIGERGKEWILANRSYSALAKQYLTVLENLVSGASDELTT